MNISVFLVVAAVIGLLVTLLVAVVVLAAIYLFRKHGGTLEGISTMKKVNSIHTRIPLGVLLVSIFYMLGAIVLLISLFSIPVGLGRSLASTHGLPESVDGFIVPAVIGIALLISIGLFTRSRGGYVLTVAYLLFFGIQSLVLMSQRLQQPYVGNAIWALLVLLYLAWKWKYFFARGAGPFSPTATAAKTS